MRHLLQRHPVPVRAHFKRSLVLTYALPVGTLRPMLPPGLELDEREGLGFLAIAMVQTEKLRPMFLPSILGRDFFLAGYRIFARWRHPDGRSLRGLRILRSDTDSRSMVWFGNLLTHYRYRLARVGVRESAAGFAIKVETEDGMGDLDLSVTTAADVVRPPDGSPFKDLREARLYAGPMPFTFDYEAETHSTVVIEGVRRDWHPRPVEVAIRKVGFLEQPVFKASAPRLANAFMVENVPYRWKRGERHPLSRNNGLTTEEGALP
jgi:hypothetical protein